MTAAMSRTKRLGPLSRYMRPTGARDVPPPTEEEQARVTEAAERWRRAREVGRDGQ